jgi:hypothetical protein
LYLGLEAGLGAPVDRQISRWDEMFIPAELANSMADLTLTNPKGKAPVVLEDVMLYQSTLQLPPQSPVSEWPRYLISSALLLLVVSLMCRQLPALRPIVVVRGWLVISGLAGFLLLFFWFFTDHSVARLNLNLLVFNPLWVALAFWRGHEKLAGLLLAGISALALLMTLLPPGQYTADVLAAFLPLNITSSLVLLRHARELRRDI